MPDYLIEAWNPGNGVAFSVYASDYFQARNVFTCATRVYLRACITRASTGQTLDSYDNTRGMGAHSAPVLTVA